MQQQQLEEIYDRLGAPSVSQLRFAALREGVGVSLKDVEQFINKKSEKQLFRKPNLSEGKTASRGPGEEYQIDLIFLSEFDSPKVVLVVMDPFNRRVSLEPASNKKPTTVAAAFRRVLERMPAPKAAASDSGAEFGGPFDAMLTNLNIVHKVRRGINSLGMLDKNIQSLKRQIGQRLSRKKDLKFEAVIPLVEEAYNNSLHSALGMTPNDAAKDDKQGRIEQFYLMKENAEAFEHNHEVAKKKMETVKEEGAFRVQNRATFQRGFKPRFGEVKQVASVERSQVKDASGKIYNINEVTAVPRDTVDQEIPDTRARDARDARLKQDLARYAQELFDKLETPKSLSAAARAMSDQFFETKPTHMKFAEFVRLFGDKFVLEGAGAQMKVRRISRRIAGKRPVR